MSAVQKAYLNAVCFKTLVQAVRGVGDEALVLLRAAVPPSEAEGEDDDVQGERVTL